MYDNNLRSFRSVLGVDGNISPDPHKTEMNSFNVVMEPHMTLGTVTYSDHEAFHKGIAAFVREGVTFEAEESSLTITLTGGY